MRPSQYDVAIIGAGPVGSVTALAFAQKGAQVLLLEANPRASERLAGEWLHPPAVRILESLGVDLTPPNPYPSGKGFVVWPDDGSSPVVMPYEYGAFGYSCEHASLVERLREIAAETASIDYEPYVRVKQIADHELVIQSKTRSAVAVGAGLIVGACGRASIVDAALGSEAHPLTYSRMAGLVLEDVELPFEGYGHVILGGPGPILSYRIDPRRVRICLDVPFGLQIHGHSEETLWEGFSSVIPAAMRRPFREALRRGRVGWAANQDTARARFGREGFVLVGDAVGHHHPLTGVGMTLGFQDAVALPSSSGFNAYRAQRLAAARVPEALAVILYEIFADTSQDAIAVRQAIYRLWRTHPAERSRTMNYLSGQDTRVLHFSRTFVRTVSLAIRKVIAEGVRTRRWRYTAELVRQLGARVGGVLSTSTGFKKAQPSSRFVRAISAQRMALTRMPKIGPRLAELPSPPPAENATIPLSRLALETAVGALLEEQAEDGSWEGEVVWCPMLPAQYVFVCHVTRTPIADQRRERLLRQFEVTRLASGTWGLHALSSPSLFVTTLVYVAARMLGVAPGDALLTPAAAFIRDQGGVVAIPSWGKFWLALLNLYRWEGVNPVLPELWNLPRWFFAHPSRYYCHTRHIYLGMATIYGEKFQVPSEPLILALRDELYPDGFERVDFGKARNELRAEDLYVKPGAMLKGVYGALRFLEWTHSERRRKSLLAELRSHIRYELRATSHTNLSPVSGMLNLIALWIKDPLDEDLRAGLGRLEGWIWEDDENGTRVAGARSATWDTAFATQALIAAADHMDVERELQRADGFLGSQQIRTSTGREQQFFRANPEGGYCFAGVWHGWPVSDCTAEAILARLGVSRPGAIQNEMTAGIRFILDSQNRDGGFGSYEARRVNLPLEWLNPAEMFGDSMTEMSYIECTASCVAALAAYHRAYPDIWVEAIEGAVARAAHAIRLRQRPDGAWDGNWGIHFIYGTLFGMRGLLAAGVVPHDPAIRRACAWIRTRQRKDGGWGEHHMSALSGSYVENTTSQAVQTAWALMALLEANDPDWDCLERGAHFLASTRVSSGSWDRQDPEGIFFHTALLDYTLYRRYFPVWALALFETRRLARLRAPARASVRVESPGVSSARSR